MALFSWLGDLVAQLLEREGIPAPQRRRWNLRGNGWDIRDDSVNERLDIFIDGEAVIQQSAPETLLVLGDDLPAAHDYLRELRRGIYENAGNVSLVGDVQSPDGFHSAIAGDTLAVIEARLIALTITEPSAIIILAGRADVDNGDSASTIAAAFTSLITAIRAQWSRSRIILGDPTRWFAPAADFAAKTAVVEALYPLLATLAVGQPRTVYLPSGSELDEDSIDASGSLPNSRGFAFLAALSVSPLQDAIPPIYGRKPPRGIVRRDSQPVKAHHVTRIQGTNISFPSPATGAGTLVIAFWFYPDALFTSNHTIITSDASFTLLLGDDRDLILRSGNGAAADITAVDAITVREWHRIVIILESGRMRFYVNGKLRGMETAAGLHNWSVTAPVTIGHATDASAPGWFADIVFSDAVSTDEQIARDYRDASGLLRNVIARYLLADLTDEMGGAAATNTGVVLATDGPLLPGEALPFPTFSPETDTDLAHWWRADMGVDKENDAWHNQTTVADSDFDVVAGGLPEAIASPLWSGEQVLSFASSGSANDGSVNRNLRTVDTFDFLNLHGYAVCIALLEHAPSNNLEIVFSNKLAVADSDPGMRISLVEIGPAFFARVNVGSGAGTATVIAAEQEMRNGAPELLSFRFGVAVGWRLESTLGVATGAQDNAPAAAVSGRLHAGADAPASTTRNFRGHIAEIVIFQTATVADLDASVVAWRAYAQSRFNITP